MFLKYFGFYSGIEDNTFVKNVGNFLPDYTRGNIPNQDNS
jgi:hypothetical protein